MKRFRITFLGAKVDCSECPPKIVYVLWPSFSGWAVYASESEILVDVPADAPSPINLGLLVKVEELPSNG
jgi:hypothetical protein